MEDQLIHSFLVDKDAALCGFPFCAPVSYKNKQIFLGLLGQQGLTSVCLSVWVPSSK